MNLKLRLALLFTFFVASLLVLSSLATYFLYYNYRATTFFEGIKNEAIAYHNLSLLLKSPAGNGSDKFINSLHSNTAYVEQVVVLDYSGRLIEKVPDTLHFSITQNIIDKIKSGKEYYWVSDNNYQHVGLVLENTKQLLLAVGYDKSGFQKLDNLKWILFFVTLGGLLVTGFFSLFFVRQAFMPLTKMSIQISKTTFQNLAQRIDVTGAKDEVNDIARNFNSMLERLSLAFEFQKSFVYHASHELRTPLATMLSQTESALERNLSEAEYKKILASLKEDQQEMIELTNSLLLISQFDQMEKAHDWPLLRIDEVLYETMSIAKRMLPDLMVNMCFGTLPESDDDFIIRGNEALLKSVFINLLKNANLYSIDHKAEITLESDGATILVHFDNKGTQLHADEKENILTPFFRGGNALKTKGYGLGLSIVYRFITIHKGTITYTPVSNDINRFTITLNKVTPAAAIIT